MSVVRNLGVSQVRHANRTRIPSKWGNKQEYFLQLWVMLLLWNIWLFMAICRIPPSLSDDSGGSGDYQGGSGLDSLDLSEVCDDDNPKKMTTLNMSDDSKAKVGIVPQNGGDARFIIPGDSDLIIDYASGHGPTVFFSEEKLKTLLRSKEVVAGAIAGAAMGLILALGVAAVMLYKRRMEDVRKGTL